DVWRLVEERFGRDAESLDALVDLSERAQRYDDVIELLTASLGSEQDRERRIAQHARLGDALRRYRNEPQRAIEQYRSALELSPTDEAARTGLRALLEDGEHAEAAAETLAHALRVADEWEALLDLVETRLVATSDPLRRRDVLL